MTRTIPPVPSALLMALSLADCGGPSPGANMAVANDVGPEAAPPAAASPVPPADQKARYLGRWIGVEGMFLDVTSRPDGGVMLEMQWDLDHRGTFPGTITAKGLRFTRNGVDEIAVPTDGDATGLKWLAGKKHCLTVKTGEGYCRT